MCYAVSVQDKQPLGQKFVDRGLVYFGLVALGAMLLILMFRRRASGARPGMLSTLIACAIAVALTYMILFKVIQ